MQQELRFATFNVCNLALPGMKYYEDQIPYSVDDYHAKTAWLAQQLDRLDADIIALQEVFSQTAVRDVLARTEKYRTAYHAGFDPATDIDYLTPNVALISRWPLKGEAREFKSLPDDLAIALPGVDNAVTHFTRPILHAQVQIHADLLINVFACHLKSKLPDYRHAAHGDAAAQRGDQTGLAMLRSLIRRGTDALGLRTLLSDLSQTEHLPTLVMGDFNDVANATSTQMVMGLGQYPINGHDHRLFDCARIQSQRSAQGEAGYTHMHDGDYEIIDHILVSEAFNAVSPHAIGEVIDVRYLNDHMLFRQPHMSDHGAVVARIRLCPHAPAARENGVRRI
jgi:endonuclease/exonuclease/phosphatase family metal-dependent hydrolase